MSNVILRNPFLGALKPLGQWTPHQPSCSRGVCPMIFGFFANPQRLIHAAELTVSFTNSLEGYARNTLVVHTLSQPLMLICPNSLSRAGPQNGAGAPIPTGFALAAPFGFCFGFVFSSVGGSPVLALSQLWEFCPAQPKSNLARCFCCELVCFWNLK